MAFGVGLPALAEKADRQQQLTIEADRTSTVDLARRVVVFNGRVVLTQGSLRIVAERMEVTELADGHRTAQATGLPERQAEFREKREGLEEFVEGRAQSIDYDSRDDLIRLNGKAVVRRLRGAQVADEIQGETIVWNGGKEFFSVMPAQAAPGGPPAGRVRAIITPPPPTANPAAPAVPAAAASGANPVNPARR